MDYFVTLGVKPNTLSITKKALDDLDPLFCVRVVRHGSKTPSLEITQIRAGMSYPPDKLRGSKVEERNVSLIKDHVCTKLGLPANECTVNQETDQSSVH